MSVARPVQLFALKLLQLQLDQWKKVPWFTFLPFKFRFNCCNSYSSMLPRGSGKLRTPQSPVFRLILRLLLCLASSTARPDCAPFLSVQNRLVFIPTNILNFSVAKLLASKAAWKICWDWGRLVGGVRATWPGVAPREEIFHFSGKRIVPLARTWPSWMSQFTMFKYVAQPTNSIGANHDKIAVN